MFPQMESLFPWAVIGGGILVVIVVVAALLDIATGVTDIKKTVGRMKKDGLPTDVTDVQEAVETLKKIERVMGNIESELKGLSKLPGGLESIEKTLDGITRYVYDIQSDVRNKTH